MDATHGGHTTDYGACTTPPGTMGLPREQLSRPRQPWLSRHVEALTLLTGMLLMLGLVTFHHHAHHPAPHDADVQRPAVQRAEVTVQQGNASLTADPPLLSPTCTYRGQLSPPNVQGGSCQCLDVPDGPAFTGPHCEGVRCSSLPMVEGARSRISPAFTALRDAFAGKCGKNPHGQCRKLVMSLRDTLNIFGFAYFPIKRLRLIWLQVPRCVPYDTAREPRERESNDPVLVLMQYTQALYQAIGDVKDTEGSAQKGAAEHCRETQDTLIKHLVDLVQSHHIGSSELTWDQYLEHPGHHNWSIHWRTSLYLQPRGGKGQFWGRLTPDPYLSCDQNGCALVTNQVEKTTRWLGDLEDASRRRPWWEVIDRRSGKEFPTVEKFHKVRKSLRAILNTHRTLPTVSAALFLPVGPPALDWLHRHSTRSLPDNATWADIFCVGEQEHCCPAEDLIALLMVNDVAQFPLETFWHIAEPDYHYVRALAVIGLGNVGTDKDQGLGSELRPRATGCPDTADKAAFRDSQTGITAASARWTGEQFDGTLCGLVPWMGALHDKMVAMQNDPDGRRQDSYVSAEAEVLGHRLQALDVRRLLRNISLGTCYAPLPPQPSSVSFPVVLTSVAIVAVIGIFLLWR